ncbi:hypothetical protein DFJ74DRAFT_314660 [Hyaloraphidium curvatum]|nr:hypothetical protein DFJ74DRAFT_314660 [Hyaloraphidium curvatum]
MRARKRKKSFPVALSLLGALSWWDAGAVRHRSLIHDGRVLGSLREHPFSLLFFASFFLLPTATTEGRRAHGRCAAPRAGDRRSTRAGLHVHPLAPLGIARNCGARSSIKPTCMCTILPVAHGSPTLPWW